MKIIFISHLPLSKCRFRATIGFRLVERADRVSSIPRLAPNLHLVSARYRQPVRARGLIIILSSSTLSLLETQATRICANT